jgi:nucleotide-binding universal stress UspA family protein
MKILIGADDSPHARAAIDYVKRARWPEGTEVFVVSVARPSVAVYTEVYAPGPAFADRVMEEQVRFCEEIANSAKSELAAAGFKVDTRILQGDPREALIDAAKAVGADLLVVGSHGRSGIARLVLGSVASHVVSHAPCNVLVVKLGKKPAA